MVDAVVAWVDGADPEHRRQRELYAKAERVDHAGAYAAARFSNNGELRYCIQLIRKNAPWIKNIFLLTDNQRPDWLDSERKVELGVCIVDHRAIFRGHEDVLPTFNSIAIETMLHRVPGLGERFIYCNDDIFITKPVTETDYFDGPVPLIRGFSFSTYKLLRELHRVVDRKSFKMNGMIGTTYAHDGGIKLTRRVKIGHVPHPINRDDYKALMESGDRFRQNIKHRFRNFAQFGPIPLYAAANLKSRKVKIVPRDDLYLDPKLQDSISVSEIRAQISTPNILHMCIQSLNEFTAQSQ